MTMLQTVRDPYGRVFDKQSQVDSYNLPTQCSTPGSLAKAGAPALPSTLELPLHTPFLARSRRTRRTPFTDRVTAAGVKAYTVYNHMLLPAVFRSVEEDYQHLKSAVQLWDVACERQIELRGPDAERLLQLTSPRDLSRMQDDQCFYVPIVDVNGGMINDPIVLKLAADRFWVSIADSDLIYYYKGLAGGFGLDVSVSEPDISPLAIQGPKTDILVERLFGQAIRETRFFRHKTIHFQGQEMVIARSGWSRQDGFEIYMDGSQHGPALWDHIMQAGEDLDIRAGCPNGIERIEAGLLSYGNDMTLENTPFEADLGKYVQLDRVPTCRARAALLEKQQPERQLRAIEMSGSPLPACTETWPLTADGQHAGQVGSAAYSPDFNTNIGIAMVEAAYWDAGTTLVVQTPVGPRDVLVRSKYWI